MLIMKSCLETNRVILFKHIQRNAVKVNMTWTITKEKLSTFLEKYYSVKLNSNKLNNSNIYMCFLNSSRKGPVCKNKKNK